MGELDDHLEKLKAEYGAKAPLAQGLIDCLVEQLSTLLRQNDVALGVPMETRVKTWDSLAEKLRRKSITLGSVCELEDFAGLRIILLFRDDLVKMDELIRCNLDVIKAENAADRLDATQFGYQSNHYIVRIPAVWAEIPSYAGLTELCAELQVRTLAQHIWAAASHKLQYKREESVPPELRRTIHRVSALLETVDLEFSRVLSEREDYLRAARGDVDLPLNVDLVAFIMNETLPEENLEAGDEPYDHLLSNLKRLGVGSTREFRDLLTKHRKKILDDEKTMLAQWKASGRAPSAQWMDERVQRGVYFSHAGLVRKALREEFGDDAVDRVLEEQGHRHVHPHLRTVRKAKRRKPAVKKASKASVKPPARKK
jgi:ppGpp synthetase/RelA/SpoT-type nucleotidyltranferase